MQNDDWWRLLGRWRLEEFSRGYSIYGRYCIAVLYYIIEGSMNIVKPYRQLITELQEFTVFCSPFRQFPLLYLSHLRTTSALPMSPTVSAPSCLGNTNMINIEIAGLNNHSCSRGRFRVSSSLVSKVCVGEVKGQTSR